MTTSREPAPEETVETTEECPSCIECAGTGEVFDREDDTRVCDRCNGTGNEPEPPAPEPAGEAEERCWRCGHVSHSPDRCFWTDGGGRQVHCTCGTPSSGTLGLTEVRTYWNVRRDGSGGWTYSRNGPSHHAWVLPEIEAAIVAEARAPLEARIAELEAVASAYNSAVEDTHVSLVSRYQRRAEDAERQLEELREALAKARDAVVLMASKSRVRSRNIDNFPASYEISVDAYEALHEAYYDAERALTPPASTAQGGTCIEDNCGHDQVEHYQRPVQGARPMRYISVCRACELQHDYPDSVIWAEHAFVASTQATGTSTTMAADPWPGAGEIDA